MIFTPGQFKISKKEPTIPKDKEVIKPEKPTEIVSGIDEEKAAVIQKSLTIPSSGEKGKDNAITDLILKVYTENGSNTQTQLKDIFFKMITENAGTEEVVIKKLTSDMKTCKRIMNGCNEAIAYYNKLKKGK